MQNAVGMVRDVIASCHQGLYVPLLEIVIEIGKEQVWRLSEFLGVFSLLSKVDPFATNGKPQDLHRRLQETKQVGAYVILVDTSHKRIYWPNLW